jgi:hypothetical protein
MRENELPEGAKKIILRAPPRSVEIMSKLEKIKDYQEQGELKHYFYVRITLIITGLISLGLGIYILLDFDSFFSEKYKINYRKSLLFFFFIYFPNAIGIFVLSLIISLIIYSFFWCCEKEKIHGQPLYDEYDASMSIEGLKIEDSESGLETRKTESNDTKEYIGVNADKVTLLPYTLTVFVILTIVFDFIALPYSINLLYNMWNDPIYKDKMGYWALYTFIFANLTNGILIVVVFFHMFLVKRIEINTLKENMDVKEELIKTFRAEVREALKKPK